MMNTKQATRVWFFFFPVNSIPEIFVWFCYLEEPVLSGLLEDVILNQTT